jgi:hypothetical protein
LYEPSNHNSLVCGVAVNNQKTKIHQNNDEFSFEETQTQQNHVTIAGEIRATSPVKSHRNHVAVNLAR